MQYNMSAVNGCYNISRGKFNVIIRNKGSYNRFQITILILTKQIQNRWFLSNDDSGSHQYSARKSSRLCSSSYIAMDWLLALTTVSRCDVVVCIGWFDTCHRNVQFVWRSRKEIIIILISLLVTTPPEVYDFSWTNKHLLSSQALESVSSNSN